MRWRAARVCGCKTGCKSINYKSGKHIPGDTWPVNAHTPTHTHTQTTHTTRQWTADKQIVFVHILCVRFLCTQYTTVCIYVVILYILLGQSRASATPDKKLPPPSNRHTVDGVVSVFLLHDRSAILYRKLNRTLCTFHVRIHV